MKGKVLFVVLVLSGLLTGAYLITRSIDNAQKQHALLASQEAKKAGAPAQGEAGPGDQNSRKKVEVAPSVLGRVFAFVLLGAILVAVIVWAYKENRGYGEKIPWKEILLQPVFISMLGILVLNTLSSLFIYHQWLWFWNQQTLFWAANMGLVLFVHFQTKKEPYAKYVASGIGLLIFFGFATTIYANHEKYARKIVGMVSGTTWSSARNISAGLSPTFRVPGKPPAETVLSTLADAETGGCVAGAGHQFEADGKPVRNPKGSKPGTGAVGKWQINLSDPEVTKIVKSHNWDVESSETDNRAAAEYLYDQRGTAPWTASAGCWGPKITMPGGIIVTLEGTTSDWSSPYPANRGFNFSTDWLGKGKPRHQIEYTTRDGSVFIREFPTKDGKNEPIKEEVASFRVKSLEKEPVIVKITFTPRT